MQKNITDQQKRLYMENRKTGDSQKLAAAKAGFSLRSAKRLDTQEYQIKEQKDLKQNTKDPFRDIWCSELKPLLEKNPYLQATTLLRHLQNLHPKQYPDTLLRTLQRRVRVWRGQHGAEKEIIFRQNIPPGWQALSDFTNCNKLKITIKGKAFPHLLYHFWLPFSKWEYALVVTGGESYSALTEGLQKALWALGGVPKTHRTDSLSAAYKNRFSQAKEDFTQRYHDFCKHYGMEPTRNNKGVKHENGSVEVAHKHLKNRLDQALMIRGSRDFQTTQEYQSFIRTQVHHYNARSESLLREERKYLAALPKHKTQDFEVEFVKVASTSTVTIRQVRYSVFSKLIGMSLKAHIYDQRIECFLESTKMITLKRLRWHGGKTRKHQIDYRHLVGALSKKPQAFRNYIFREHLFPTLAFKLTWKQLDLHLDSRTSCKEYISILKLAADHDESKVSRCLEQMLSKNELPKQLTVQKRLGLLTEPKSIKVRVESPDLASYNQLLTQENNHEFTNSHSNLTTDAKPAKIASF